MGVANHESQPRSKPAGFAIYRGLISTENHHDGTNGRNLFKQCLLAIPVFQTTISGTRQFSIQFIKTTQHTPPTFTAATMPGLISSTHQFLCPAKPRFTDKDMPDMTNKVHIMHHLGKILLAKMSSIGGHRHWL
jgi:hypothetical protein